MEQEQSFLQQFLSLSPFSSRLASGFCEHGYISQRGPEAAVPMTPIRRVASLRILGSFCSKELCRLSVRHWPSGREALRPDPSFPATRSCPHLEVLCS